MDLTPALTKKLSHLKYKNDVGLHIRGLHHFIKMVNHPRVHHNP